MNFIQYSRIRLVLLLPIVLIITLLTSCGDESQPINLDIIPNPNSVTSQDVFSKIKDLRFDDPSMEVYSSWLNDSSIKAEFNSSNPNVFIKINEAFKPRTYNLDIGADTINIEVQNQTDIRNALVTLIQIAELNQGKFVQSTIVDQAEFDYRGMHLDVCRHFFPASDIKKYIDYLTYYKFNNFHWHLTEDQGWRIEIKQYPKLQTVAAYRDETLVGHYNDQPHKFDGQKYGGFYTQEEIKEIVAYATARGIRVIPEIEMPGHAQAALAAYPELGCEDKEYKTATKWGVFKDVYCPTETTFEFLENVLDEVIELFPSEYIHIGGDECPKEAWKESAFCQNLMKEKGLKNEFELQSYFIGRMADYLKTKGKTIIGWDEILEGGLNEGSVVMSWRGEKGGIEAAKSGHEVIMTPGTHCYFDHYQSEHVDEPTAIGGLTTVQKVYSYQVIPDELEGDERYLVKGAQGNVWTEYIPKFSQVEYMALARMMTLSEVLFNNPDNRNFDKYQERLRTHIDYWKNKDVHIADHQLDLTVKVEVEPGIGSIVKAESNLVGSTISVTYPNGRKSSYKEEVTLDESGKYEFSLTYNGVTGRSSMIDYEGHKGTTASIELKTKPSNSYPGSGSSCIINGVQGSNEKYGGSEWIGYGGRDFEAVLEWDNEETFSKVELRFFKGEGQWIYLPKKVDIYSSIDGESFKLESSQENIETKSKVAIVSFSLDISTKYLKIIAYNHGEIEEGKQGAGHKAWLFVDEIVLK